MVREAHAAGLRVIPWTVDDPETMRSLVDIGVDGLITDYPDRLRTVLSDAGFRLPRGYRAPAVRPLARAHAHNDYEHRRPLADALDRGFSSVEADVWLVGNELLVAHDLADARTGRTLSSLYLDPLQSRTEANGGQVYRRGDPGFQLLVDIKSEGVSTYLALDRVLRQYPDLLTSVRNGQVRERR